MEEILVFRCIIIPPYVSVSKPNFVAILFIPNQNISIL